MKVGTKLLCYNSYPLSDLINIPDFIEGEHYEITSYSLNLSMDKVIDVEINKVWFSLNPDKTPYLFDCFLSEKEELKMIRKIKLEKINNLYIQ